jgi:hypothetical protein
LAVGDKDVLLVDVSVENLDHLERRIECKDLQRQTQLYTVWPTNKDTPIRQHIAGDHVMEPTTLCRQVPEIVTIKNPSTPSIRTIRPIKTK